MGHVANEATSKVLLAGALGHEADRQSAAFAGLSLVFRIYMKLCAFLKFKKPCA